jgi:hypothetical protein
MLLPPQATVWVRPYYWGRTPSCTVTNPHTHANNQIGPLGCAGDAPADAPADVPATVSTRGRPAALKCSKCRRKGKPCGPNCPDWPDAQLGASAAMPTPTPAPGATAEPSVGGCSSVPALPTRRPLKPLAKETGADWEVRRGKWVPPLIEDSDAEEGEGQVRASNLTSPPPCLPCAHRMAVLTHATPMYVCCGRRKRRSVRRRRVRRKRRVVRARARAR